MDWAVDFVTTPDKEDVRLMRETLEAKLRADSGQYGEAARILWELLVQVRHDKNWPWECMTLVHMGKVYRVLRWSIATKLFEEALQTAELRGFARAQMMAIAELGEMKCSWGQFEESLDLLHKALELVEPGDLASRRELLLDLVVAYEGCDDMPRCKRLLEEVLKLDREMETDEIEEDLDHYQRICRCVPR